MIADVEGRRMGGVYVSCGAFSGRDKSCSAISGVVDEIIPLADPAELRLLAPIIEWLEVGPDHVVIDACEAQGLLPLIVRYREIIETQIAPIRDPFEQMGKDHSDDPTLDVIDAKYGKGLGWRYYCVLDLEKAMMAAGETGDPVALVRD
jgi:hypothetical protein